jgi:hypothetical protein
MYLLLLSYFNISPNELKQTRDTLNTKLESVARFDKKIWIKVEQP